MKIVKVEVFVICLGCNFVILKIIIEDGIMGFGDVIFNGCEFFVVFYLQDYFCLQFIGCDVYCIEDIWQFFYKGVYWCCGLVMMLVILVVDMVLWDIKVKVVNMLFYQLFGGVFCEGVMVYCYIIGYSIDEVLDDYVCYQELGFKVICVQCGIFGMKIIYGMLKGKGLVYEFVIKGQWLEEQLWLMEKYFDFMLKLFDVVCNKFGFNEYLLYDMYYCLMFIEVVCFGKSIEDYCMFWMEDLMFVENQECFCFIC